MNIHVVHGRVDGLVPTEVIALHCFCIDFTLYKSLRFFLVVGQDDCFGLTVVIISTSPSAGMVTEELLR